VEVGRAALDRHREQVINVEGCICHSS
jgi:hypothetical protein